MKKCIRTSSMQSYITPLIRGQDATGRVQRHPQMREDFVDLLSPAITDTDTAERSHSDCMA
eukprot:6199702-Amphidinium_carterae.1